MKLYWSLKSIPELADLPNKQRKEIWKSCRLKCLMTWPFWGSTITIIVFWLVILTKLGYFYRDRHLIGLIWGAVISAIVVFIMWQVEIALVKPYIRKYLISHGKRN